MQRNHNIGSISSGTMREEDLIPAFLSELQSQKPCKQAHKKLIREIEARMESENYYESEDEDSTFDLEALFDALNEYAPPYFYFGAHPGDGADYGYWLTEGFVEEFDGLKVNDTSEVPKGYRGEVLHVNDHGNVTLYVANRLGLHEVWGIV